LDTNTAQLAAHAAETEEAFQDRIAAVVATLREMADAVERRVAEQDQPAMQRVAAVIAVVAGGLAGTNLEALVEAGVTADARTAALRALQP
jgi:hypothetical protein